MSKLHISLQTQKVSGPWHALHESFRASAHILKDNTAESFSISGAYSFLYGCKGEEYILTT